MSRTSIGLEGTLASLPLLALPLYRGARLTDALSLSTGVEAWVSLRPLALLEVFVGPIVISWLLTLAEKVGCYWVMLCSQAPGWAQARMQEDRISKLGWSLVKAPKRRPGTHQIGNSSLWSAECE